MPKLWDVPHQIDEVFYTAATYSISVGTMISEACPEQPGSKLVGIVDAQLTDKDVLTEAGKEYCANWGVKSNAAALRQWAARTCKCD